MRRRLAVLAAAPLIFAAACGTDTSGVAPSGGSSAAAAASGLKVTGAANAKPTVTFPQGTPPAKSSFEVVEAGTGAAVKTGDKVIVNLTIFNWDGKTNAAQGSTYDAQQRPETIEVGQQLPKVMQDGFAKLKHGGRLVTVVAADSYSKEQIEQAKAQGQDMSATKVFVFDVVGTPPTPLKAAEGKETGDTIKGVKLDNPGGDKAPTLTTKTSAKAPKDLVVKTVIEGTGKKVEANQQIVAHYTGKLWGTDKQFDSSWERGEPATFALNGVIQGWSKGLTGVPVGSRVVMSVPAAQGYGDQANGDIPANSTLVFVVDVLAAY